MFPDCDVTGMAIGDAAGLISWIALEHRPWILAVSDQAERLWPLQSDDVFAGRATARRAQGAL